VSHWDQHPTIEQLSTWLDQQPRQARGRGQAPPLREYMTPEGQAPFLREYMTPEGQAPFLREYMTPEEQAFCSTHLEDCEECQHMLDNLQQTISLLRSLPQLEVPRSFALPADLQITTDRNKQVEQLIAVPPRRFPKPLRQTLRAVSALAAVIGLFFTLSGFVAPPQLHSGSMSAISMSASSTANLSPSAQQRQAAPQAAGANISTPNNTDNTNNDNANTAKKAVKTEQGTETNATAPEPIRPFDFKQPGERLFIGIPLTILGCMGFVLFAQRRERRTRLAKRNR